ncbi:LRFN1 [Branchiostoma lanceolatum]|uniref:LRFN1 protein n=1 Tax=Branchiostoma lanceolatum TaxID=7740 RepID=A0A8J9W181_BRALA|nr:LRFN1 [Branchiostoma lanceolatum]
MGGPKTSILVMLLILGTSQACPSCNHVCPRRRKIGCNNPYRICQQSVDCNVTGLNCSNQELSSCLRDEDDVLLLTGHHDSNGTLNLLPSLPMLDRLTLSGGYVKAIKNGTFENFSSLRLLSLNGNSIQVVGIWFEGLEVMERLYMSRNKIGDIERGALRPLKKLQVLDLSCNRIRSIEAWYFEGLSSLSELNLNHNEISRVAANAFNLASRGARLYLSYNMLRTLSPGWLQSLPTKAIVHLDSNLLPTIRKETLDALRGKLGYVWNNPFRCTCALNSLKTAGATILERTDNLYCSYPPHLSGKKVSQVSGEDMPCPPPVAEVSRADNGTTLLCQVYWEQQPDISWVGPEGNNINASSNTSGNGITTHLEHDVTPEGHTLSFGTDCSSQHAGSSTLNFMVKSTYKLHLSQEAFLEWTEGAYRCVITYPVGNFSISMGLSLTNPKANDSRSLTSDDEEEGVISTTEKMLEEYFILPPRQHLQHPCLLNLIYTGVITVIVSLLVSVLVGCLIRIKRPKDPNNLATRELPPLPLNRLSSQVSLHHYEVISDEAASSLPAGEKKLSNHQRRSRHTGFFNNPQYGYGNAAKRRSKHTEVFYNPQYGQGNRKRRWSTPVLATYNGSVAASKKYPLTSNTCSAMPSTVSEKHD